MGLVNNGLFTVRSAYGVSLKLLQGASYSKGRGEGLDKANVSQFW